MKFSRNLLIFENKSNNHYLQNHQQPKTIQSKYRFVCQPTSLFAVDFEKLIQPNYYSNLLGRIRLFQIISNYSGVFLVNDINMNRSMTKQSVFLWVEIQKHVFSKRLMMKDKLFSVYFFFAKYKKNKKWEIYLKNKTILN